MSCHHQDRGVRNQDNQLLQEYFRTKSVQKKDDHTAIPDPVDLVPPISAPLSQYILPHRNEPQEIQWDSKGV
jgi:hypothetical protein